MGLVIKLKRSGHIRLPAYSIIVGKKQGPGLGRVYEKLGYIVFRGDSTSVVSIKKQRLAYWVSQGVPILSQRLKKILLRTGVN